MVNFQSGSHLYINLEAFLYPPSDNDIKSSTSCKSTIFDCETLKQIIVFSPNQGTISSSIDAIIKQVRTTLNAPWIQVFKVNSELLRDISWEDNTALIIFGAGNLDEWNRQFGDDLKQRLVSYVKNGGKCLGIGPGAAFLSEKSIRQYKDDKHITSHGIGLFSGNAIGPLFDEGTETECYLISNARSVHVVRELSADESTFSGAEGKLYYQGSCAFDKSSNEDMQALVSYKMQQSQMPAIIGCKSGLGSVVVAGPQIEYKWTLDSSHDAVSVDKRYIELLQELSLQENFRLSIWNDVFVSLGLLKRPT